MPFGATVVPVIICDCLHFRREKRMLSIQRSGDAAVVPIKPGRPPKPSTGKTRSLAIDMYDDDIRRFKDLAKSLGKTHRGTLIYLIDMEENRGRQGASSPTRTSTPQRSRLAVRSPRSLSPVRPTIGANVTDIGKSLFSVFVFEMHSLTLVQPNILHLL